MVQFIVIFLVISELVLTSTPCKIRYLFQDRTVSRRNQVPTFSTLSQEILLKIRVDGVRNFATRFLLDTVRPGTSSLARNSRRGSFHHKAITTLRYWNTRLDQLSRANAVGSCLKEPCSSTITSALI